ncbi:hypothetical protein SB861_29240 [Paraburkholderia sp. SIMBA_049]|jgi:hypothetical protein|uniref:hypothetical protein n=1 Tax=Paraburkholderia hospita TaxID=169430 RepID=UPI003A068A1D
MSNKFDMKVVIDPVTTPLLHARLGQAASYRERAALLRSLAEAALRGDGNGTRPEWPTAFSVGLPTSASVAYEPARQLDVSPRVDRDTAAIKDGEPATNERDADQAFDVDQIGEAFGAFV